MRATAWQGFGQLALAPALILRRGQADRLGGGVPPSRKHGQQLTLAQGEQAQYGVVDAQLALPLSLPSRRLP